MAKKPHKPRKSTNFYFPATAHVNPQPKYASRVWQDAYFKSDKSQPYAVRSAQADAAYNASVKK